MAIALNAVSQFFDNYGNPLSGGKVWTYVAGTLNPLASYTNQDGDVLNSNPVVLDAAGRAQIWLTPNVAYKIVVMDASNVEVETTDEFYAGMNPEQLNIAGLVPATGGEYTGPVVLSGGATFAGDATENLATLDSLGIASVAPANLATNSDFAIAQRGLGAIADGGYSFDQIVTLTQTAPITLSQLTAPTDGIPYAMRQTQSNATAQRIGFTQILEARKCLAFRGSQLVFAPKVRCSIGTTIRAALAAWVGTGDAPTRDVINNWTSTNYTANNFFVANTLPIAVSAVSVSADTWTDLPVSSVSAGGVVAPSTMNNLYLIVWSDAALAQNVTMDYSLLRAGRGTSIPLWLPPDPATELAKCERFYEVGLIREDGYGQGGQAMITSCRYRTAKRTTPAITYQNTISTGLSSNVVNANGPDSCLQILTLSGAVFLTYTGANNWQASCEF